MIGPFPISDRRGLFAAEVVALVVLSVLDDVVFLRYSGHASGWLATLAVEFAPGLGPVTAVLAVLRRRFPAHTAGVATAVSGLSLFAAAVTLVVGALGQYLPPQPSAVSALAISLVVGASCHRLRPRVAAAQAALGGVAAVSAPILSYGAGSPAALFSAVAALGWGGALAIGLILRDAEARGNARLAEVRTAERLRLARELHDLVAHQITGVVVRVQAARRVTERQGGDTAAFAEIEDAGAEALASMRRLVGTLRTDGEHLFTPPSGLLSAVDQAVPDDGSVALDVPEDLASLAAAPEVVTTVHRLITESLTNARRHAPQATELRVGVRHDESAEPESLVVEIVNDGVQRAARPGGYGLAGMAERVSAVGGTVHAGPEPGQRWRVSARLPLRPG